MPRKILATFALLLNFWTFAPQISEAATTDNFDVFNVFSFDESTNESEEGSMTIDDNLREDAEALAGETKGNLAIAVIMRAIDVLLLLIGTFAFLVIFYSGFLLVTANGDEGKLDKGKGMIVPAIWGLLFAFLSYYIVLFVQSFFY